MNDQRPQPSGLACKCGAEKKETEYFCARCTAKLPEHLLQSFSRCRSTFQFRELNHRAAVVLGLPLTKHQQRVTERRRAYYA